MNFSLPTSVMVDGVEYDIRSDYRAVLEICAALSDPELSGEDKTVVMLDIFYPAFSPDDGSDPMPPQHYAEAAKACCEFINCGNAETQKRAPKLVDWEQDFQHIVAPINRIAGQEIRSVPYMHWWTFVSFYYEIGDCLFAQIVRIRDKLSRGKPLDKEERRWYRENKELVDFKSNYTAAEDELLKEWT